MALKSVDDVDGNGFDDELSATEGQELKTMLNLEIFGGMNPLR